LIKPPCEFPFELIFHLSTGNGNLIWLGIRPARGIVSISEDCLEDIRRDGIREEVTDASAGREERGD